MHVPERNCLRLRFSHWTLGVPLMQRYVVAKNQQIKRHFDGRWCQLRNKQLSQYTVVHVFTYLQSPGYCWKPLGDSDAEPTRCHIYQIFWDLGIPNHDISPHGRSKSKLRHHSYRCTNANVLKDQHERSWRYCMSFSYSRYMIEVYYVAYCNWTVKVHEVCTKKYSSGYQSVFVWHVGVLSAFTSYVLRTREHQIINEQKVCNEHVQCIQRGRERERERAQWDNTDLKCSKCGLTITCRVM